MPFTPTRRSFIAGAASALSFPHVLAAQGRAFDVDVAIVGAGSAGLAAARELQTLGKTFALVEARDRIGGRVVTDRSLGGAFDGGALYIHWAETNPWAEVARTLGMETTPDRGPRGAFRIFENGRPVPENERGRRRAAFQTLSRELDLDPPSVPDISVVERVRDDGDDVLNAAAGMTRMALGEEPERVSARDYAQLWSGEDLYVPEGYGALVERFGAGLPVSLSTPVRAIRWGGPGVEVETAKGTIRARRAIVTVPVGVLIEESIAFDPVLPGETLAGIEGLEMGVLAKVALGFRGARFGLPANTDIFEIEGPRATYNFDCWPFDRDIVVAHVGGDHAREIIGLGTEGAIQRTLEAFARIVGNDARRSFAGGRVHGWIDDPWALGAYSHARPGHARARASRAARGRQAVFRRRGDGRAGGRFRRRHDRGRCLSRRAQRRAAGRGRLSRVGEILARANGIFTMRRFARAIMSLDLLHGLRCETARKARPSQSGRARMIVFDSGLGGLTVFDEIVKAAPAADILYVADDAAFPYGRLSEAGLVARVIAVMRRLVALQEPDAIVIACNTASTLVLAPLRELFPHIPVIGTVPAVKPAAQASRSGLISVLATPGTVARDYTRRLVDEYARHCEVTLVGSRELAGLAERAMRGLQVEDAAIRAEIASCFVARGERRTDAVVLACTHYPLLTTQFRRLAPWPVAWIDPAPAIARRAVDVLGLSGAALQGSGQRRAVFTSGRTDPGLARVLTERGLSALAFEALRLESLASGESLRTVCV